MYQHLVNVSIINLDNLQKEQKKLFVNARISDKHNYIDNFLTDCIGDGRGYNKRSDPKVYEAIHNAREASNPEEIRPLSLGCDVYKLVRKLVK